MSHHLTVTVASHFFKVTKITSRARPCVMDLVNRYVRYGLVKTGRGGFKREPTAIYAARTRDKEEYRFHINQLPEFKELLGKHNLTTLTEWVHLLLPEGTSLEMPVREGWKLRPHQVPIFDFLTSTVTTTPANLSSKAKLVAIQPGGGKGQKLDSRILTPKGWARMGDMKIGTKVICPDRSVGKVIGVYPQGLKQTYEMVFEDGRGTDCDGTHLWKIYHSPTSKYPRVVATTELIERLKAKKPVYIDLVVPTIAYTQNRTVVSTELDQLTPIQQEVWANGGIAKIKRGVGKWILTIAYPPHGKLELTEIIQREICHTQCIKIDHPDELYITDNYIVTHNTSISMFAAAHYAKRFMVIIRPMYIEKWQEDIPNILNVRKDQVMTVQGGKQLMTLLSLASTDQLGDTVAIIMSNRTYQIWLKTYAKYGELANDLGYIFPPDEYYEQTGIGLRINDENHQDIHLQFLTDLFTNCPRTIGLSGSFVSTDSFITNIQALLYPPQCRYYEDKINKYVTSTAVFYNIRDMRHIKTEYNGSPMYSHTCFEESIMKHPKLFGGYTAIVEHMVDNLHMREYKPGERCLIFCATKEMCGKFQAIFQRKYPHLKVSRYVDDDPYENLMESDMTFSTVLSAGTAHDVAMLKTVIMTISLESLQSNIQAFGRLRDIPGVKTLFAYLVCLDIPKHVNYHRSKKELLLSRAKSYSEQFIPFSISSS